MSGAPVRRFQDLIAWQRARVLTKAIYDVTSEGHFSRDVGLRDQTRRAAVSVMANIAEGFERNGLGEFQRFLPIAKASCAELQSHLHVALDAGHIPQPAFDCRISQSEEVSRIIGALRASIEKRRNG